MQSRYIIVPAPSILGMRPTGVHNLPDALLQARLAERLGALVHPTLHPAQYSSHQDPASGLANVRGMVDFTLQLADLVANIRDCGWIPLVLGGDCSILLGNLLALRRRGRYGLLFLDGHADFDQPAANVNDEIASSDLALATGRGPAELTRLDALTPLVRDEDVVVVGPRDSDEARKFGRQPLPPDIVAFPLPAIRLAGAGEIARRAAARLVSPELDGYWVHFDVDVTDDALMPAVDYRQPGGLTWDEAAAILRAAVNAGGFVGLDLTIFNPGLDEGGSLATQLVDLLAESLS